MLLPNLSTVFDYTTEDVARKQKVSKHTNLCLDADVARKRRFGGMEASEADKLTHLRDENARLKKPWWT